MSQDYPHQDACSEHQHSRCCCHHHHEHDDFAHQLLKLADEAWMEVLKEKLKEQIRKDDGESLDALAKLASDSNSHRWKSKLGLQNSVRDFKSKLDSFFKR